MSKNKKIILIVVLVFSGIVFLSSLFGDKDKSILDFGGSDDQIAVIEVYGPITSSRRILKLLRHYEKKESVKALVIRINSPGGPVAAVQEIYEGLRRVRKNGKKVVASFGNVAASGGYYIACGADKIVTNPGTITGSIGVIMQITNFENLIKKVGVDVQVIKSGAHKDIGSPVRKMTKEEKKLLEGVINDVYDQFVEAVADGRGLGKEEVKKYADGRIFSGRQAKEYGLVDSIGTMEDAIDLAKDLAHIPGKPRVIIEKKPLQPFWKYLSGIFRGKIEGYATGSLPAILYQM